MYNVEEREVCMRVRLGAVATIVKRENVRHWGKPFSTDGYAVRFGQLVSLPEPSDSV